MVATRRAARRSEPAPSTAGSNGSPMCPSMEGTASVRATRSRRKVNSQPDVISESHFEKMKDPKAKLDVEEQLEVADSVAELQADGYISEAESNCSSVTGLQTPSFIRVTRRRQIVVPCQLESPAKNRPNRRTLPNEDSKFQDDDISESESCCSTVSGMQTSSAPRMTRSRQAKANIAPVYESQAEVVSDAESWCSGVSVEPSAQFKRMTRSMRLRLQAETISQGERKSEIVVGDEKSQTIIISDTEPTRSDFDKQLSSCVSTTQSNEQPGPHSESIIGGDLKQRFSSNSKTTTTKSTKTTPKKEMRKDRDCEIVDCPEEEVEKGKNIRESSRKEMPNDVYEILESSEEMCEQASEKPSKGTEKSSPVKYTPTVSRQTAPNKDKHSMETRKLSQNCFHQPEETIDVDKLHETGNLQNDIIASQIIESSDEDCRMSVVSIGSDESQEDPVAESSLCTAKQIGDEGCSTMSLLISDESGESDSSDLEETSEMNMTANCTNRCEQTALDTSHSEVLFAIDKTPGLHTSKTYYLEDKDPEIDGECRKSNKSSELEEDEEEFIDDDEDSLNVTNKVLSLSSSIDPGLDIKDLGGLYINFDAGKQKPGSHGIRALKEKKKKMRLLQRSTVTPDFEKRECVPPLRESVHQPKKQRRSGKKTTGDGWFGMKAPEMTGQIEKIHLLVLKMRAAIDPKRFYKKNDREGLPKYFQVGTIVDSPVDFYHARIPKKERKKTIVEELLADAEFRRYNKRKYKDIIAEKAALAAGKKNKIKKKYHK
ncbi:LOW QUALITY PROTEIN: deoxynucleotidyltransferase terminal-interacting protein 2 [Sphaerodactylus townsendi]|uniref:LOW QUALITY PROTEIN: deoxynucleotidyltransferase terminal-interacting protein 2 n=1 Tax=Sphaerodactylus townsendi TaxID=933632 RepID=UPI002025D13E|nr:LOW QUALITY PROTEIN: deoxynucleotidyltransferase terminal-interacting protein 2 [Sphaerodactylus townsendi]